jgi:sugar lactone lactonase YvrE
MRYAHGEGARWDARRGELLWVDIGAGRLLRAAPDAVDDPHVHEVGTTLGAATPYAAGGWLLAAGRGLQALDEQGGQHPVAELEPAGIRMNDATCDPHGPLLRGQHGPRPGQGRGLAAPPRPGRHAARRAAQPDHQQRARLEP